MKPNFLPRKLRIILKLIMHIVDLTIWNVDDEEFLIFYRQTWINNLEINETKKYIVVKSECFIYPRRQNIEFFLASKKMASKKSLFCKIEFCRKHSKKLKLFKAVFVYIVFIQSFLMVSFFHSYFVYIQDGTLDDKSFNNQDNRYVFITQKFY